MTNVATTVTRLQVEYLAGDTPIGIGSVAVSLNSGETVEISKGSTWSSGNNLSFASGGVISATPGATSMKT